MLTVLLGIVVLGVLVFVHELGHYAGAKALGVRVLKFSLGFGPELLGFTAKGTRYVIAAFPLGGFVKMAGDSPDATDREGASDEFYSRPWWSRMIIAVSGPGMNLFFAFLACVVMYAVGIKFLDFESVVGSVEPRSVATEYGFTDRFGNRKHPLYGRMDFHNGLDIAAPYRTPIIAPADGVVTYSAYEKSKGRALTIDHGMGLYPRDGVPSKRRLFSA